MMLDNKYRSPSGELPLRPSCCKPPIEIMEATYCISCCEMIYYMISKELGHADFATISKRLFGSCQSPY
jgi:hypothetical protein